MNELDIPELDIELQAIEIAQPVSMWGALGRNKKMPGTWLFYTDDYRFNNVKVAWHTVINTECTCAAEPNFTTLPDMPMAKGIWQIYCKRLISKRLQKYGIKILVDVVVAEKFWDINLMGVPRGWRAYSYRGSIHQTENAIDSFNACCEHAGTNNITFLYYGGGAACRELAERMGWFYVPEHQAVKTGGILRNG